jgi:hypothetical protein
MSSSKPKTKAKPDALSKLLQHREVEHLGMSTLIVFVCAGHTGPRRELWEWWQHSASAAAPRFPLHLDIPFLEPRRAAWR